MWIFVIVKFFWVRDGDFLVYSLIFYSVGKVCFVGVLVVYSEVWWV